MSLTAAHILALPSVSKSFLAIPPRLLSANNSEALGDVHNCYNGESQTISSLHTALVPKAHVFLPPHSCSASYGTNSLPAVSSCVFYCVSTNVVLTMHFISSLPRVLEELFNEKEATRPRELRSEWMHSSIRPNNMPTAQITLEETTPNRFSAAPQVFSRSSLSKLGSLSATFAAAQRRRTCPNASSTAFRGGTQSKGCSHFNSMPSFSHSDYKKTALVLFSPYLLPFVILTLISRKLLIIILPAFRVIVAYTFCLCRTEPPVLGV